MVKEEVRRDGMIERIEQREYGRLNREEITDREKREDRITVKR